MLLLASDHNSSLLKGLTGCFAAENTDGISNVFPIPVASDKILI